MDIKHPRWMCFKAALFVLIGICCFVLVWMDHPTLATAACLVVMVWAFSRAYYFAFYVIEKYIDDGYRFSGLFSFLRYLARKRKQKAQPAD